MTKTLEPGKRVGEVTIPSSKSLAHRVLIASALSGVEPPAIRGESKDTLATRAVLKAMLSGDPVWPCGESGTTLRLLEPIAGVKGFRGEFRLEGRLAERPRLAFERKSRYVLPGGVSSQFVSGLLMALPLADWDSEIVVEGGLKSAAYVALTESVLTASGIEFSRSGDTWKVRGRQTYRFHQTEAVEGDWSQAAFFLAMGVKVNGLKSDSLQGDRKIVELISAIDEGARTLDVDATPDLYPVLAAYAFAKKRDIAFTGTERLRYKESDRLKSTASMLASISRGEAVDPLGDHRIAMASAILSNYWRSPIIVLNAECVEKSYPAFWRDFDSLERSKL